MLAALAAVAVIGVAGCGSGGGSDGGGPSPSTRGGATPGAFEPPLPPNPHLGPAGTATMHGDSGSSDTTPRAGPGAGPVDVASVDLGAVCPTVLIGSDGYPVALCTRVTDVRPVVHLLDPHDGAPLASLEVTAGSLFGGVYGYLDDENRMVLVDGAADLVRIGHRRAGQGWALEVAERTPLADSVPAGDTVTSVAPDYAGGVWFATGGGTVGLVDTGTGSTRTLALGDGERVSNSISTAPVGMTVATDHALYLLDAGPDGRPEVRWRLAYDRGPARKPGQLSWGTGSTPTFFGPTDGADYVAVVDNADPQVHLVVVRATGPDAGRQVCAPVVLARGGPGSENSPIGAGDSVVVASTYGYVYPRLPEDAGPSRPATAPFAGGMTRVDVASDGAGCEVVWDTDVRSAAVPRLSTADGTITTITRPRGAAGFAYAVVDADTGELLAEQDLGASVADPLQLAGTIGPDQVLYQGTVGAVLRITPSSSDRGSLPGQRRQPERHAVSSAAGITAMPSARR